ncbi:amphi-Trp domain-containing protein [Natronomonas amylolytica]|uniref:amphi-Trp domain-containing protein n=1 Tax=Natronomonas amylolytica TaxID=3108498 RepID=UPI00300B1A70
MEEVLFESEKRQSRSETAEMLRAVADKLDAGESVSLSAGEQSVTLTVPETHTFEVKAERETGGGESELSVEFELEWDENGESGDGDASLDIA